MIDRRKLLQKGFLYEDGFERFGLINFLLLFIQEEVQGVW